MAKAQITRKLSNSVERALVGDCQDRMVLGLYDDILRIRERKNQKTADVWKKDVWDFQAFSQTFLELRFP